MFRRATAMIAACLLVTLAASVTRAEVEVTIDQPTLNELLPALTVNGITLPVSETQSLAVFLEDLQVTGFDPAADGAGSGHILTSLRLRVPQLGLNVPVAPRLSLHIVETPQGEELELRFEYAEIALPLLGRIDVARFLPPLRFPAQNFFGVDGARGKVRIRSRLTRVDMGQKLLRLSFQLEALGTD